MRSCIYILTFCILVSGCTVLNMLPNKQRDKWYTEHATDLSEGLDFLRKVNIGDTKEQVIEAWGEPLKKKRGDVWVYHFSQYFSNKTLIKFENGVVVKKWGSMW